MPSRRALVSLALAIGATMLGGCARERAPAVDYVLLNGQKASSRDWQGKVMLVNFWATSCVTCVIEMPEIVATHEKFKTRGFDTLAVAMSYDRPAYVARFAESRKLPFGVAIDSSGEIAKQFGEIRLTPTTLLIDKHGKIVKRYVGAPDFAALHSLIEKLLADN